ncbi:MAG TPA: NAD-dependent epimerase/dehydratase family protein [Actinotalea sp.]|nr:NAD-dependent epimerase/dehydratase family protein [Actinotalea sp.]
MRALLTGGAGMLGRSIADEWARLRPADELVVLTRDDVDLRDPVATRRVLERVAPDTVVHAAAKVGGIGAKLAHPVTYLRDNLLLDTSVLGAAIDVGVPELVYIGSAAVYPQAYERPFVEDDMLSGHLEGANEGYAIAKIAAAKLCEYASREHGLAYRVAVPSNLYGPHDHFSSSGAHLIAAALTEVHRAHEAGEPTVTIWGDGTARREFTWAVDLAGWIVGQVGVLAAWPDRLNLGCGFDHSIDEYYHVAAEVVGYTGTFVHDLDKPGGVPRRLIDSSAARDLGWDPPTPLRDGMAQAYAHLLQSL